MGISNGAPVRVGVLFMASPQLEDGFTRLANELLEEFCRLEVSGACHRILRFIERKTYGFQKKEDAISFTQFEEGTGLYRNTVNESLETLISMGVIIKDKSGYINKYTINKDYEKWTSNQKRTSNQNQNGSSNQKRTKTSNQKRTHKRKKEKKDIGEKISQEDSPLKVKNSDMGAWDKPSDNDDGMMEIDMDSRQEIKPIGKVKRHYKEVFNLFKEIQNTPPLTWNDWIMNTTEQKAADNLYTAKGLEQIQKALELYEDNKENKFIPKIYSPSSLVRKWKPLLDFKKDKKL